MRTMVCGLLLGVSMMAAAGCARPVKVARPVEGVEYVVVRETGMIPQARLLRCQAGTCEEVYAVDPAERGGPRP